MQNFARQQQDPRKVRTETIPTHGAQPETLDVRKRDMLRTLFRRLISAILWVTSGSGLMNFVWIRPQRRGSGRTFWARDMVTPIFRQIPHFARSLAAAIGTTAFTAVRARSAPAFPRGTSTATLACGACVTRSKQKGRPKGQPLNLPGE